jgi:hypothetical protein
VYCKLITSCGCFKYLDLPKDLAYTSFRIPLPSRTIWHSEDTPLQPDLQIREFRYERHRYDELLHDNIPILVEVLK